MTSQPPAKLLFLAAAPDDREKLRFDRELRNVREGLRLARFGDRFDLDDVLASRPKDLHRALLDLKPRIVHFSGHGDSSGQILLEGDNGWAKPVATEALADLFALCKEGLDCVILNACSSTPQAKALARHIPFVIGMKREIEDHAAICFVEGFYDALGAGKSYADAFEHGRARVSLEGLNAHNLPTLYRSQKKGDTSHSRALQNPGPSAGHCAPALSSVAAWEPKLTPETVRVDIEKLKAQLLEDGPQLTVHISVALLYLQLRNFDQALYHLNAALVLDPQNPETYFYLAVALLRGRAPATLPDPEKAQSRDKLNHALRLDSYQGKYHYLLAVLSAPDSESGSSSGQKTRLAANSLRRARRLRVSPAEVEWLKALVPSTD